MATFADAGAEKAESAAGQLLVDSAESEGLLPDQQRSDLSRSARWASTMSGQRGTNGYRLAHRGAPSLGARKPIDRVAREELEQLTLAEGATKAQGSGSRSSYEEPDEYRTCFERDRDRILHSSAFRRLAGKTQVFVFPGDHQRTRLTHALEVAQVATAVARATGLNVPLVEAIALGHDCGHGPGGHASEEAFEPYLEGRFDHATWGADVVLKPLNLTVQVLDGIRNHSWSRPAPSTPEGEVVSWADRCAYVAHDLEDALHSGIVKPAELPSQSISLLGSNRSEQLRRFIEALTYAVLETGQVCMQENTAEALATLRAFNYSRIYLRAESVAQSDLVIAVLRSLVERFIVSPQDMPAGEHLDPGSADAVMAAVQYVGGMTDRFAFQCATSLLGWDRTKLPRGIDISDL